MDPEAFVKAIVAQKIKIGNLNVFHGSSLDRLERDSVTDESEGYPEIKELGVKLHSIEDKMPWEVRGCKEGKKTSNWRPAVGNFQIV